MANSTAFKKGEKRPGQGRPKGSVDKGNAMIRDMIAQALHNAGGVAYLQECAEDPKTKGAFLSLIGKVMPVQIEGGGGGPIETIGRIELVALSGSNSQG